MSPELFIPGDFGLKDGCQTKQSDCYALGMVIYEVLSGKVPFAQNHGYAIIGGIIKGGRPRRPQKEEGMWFTDGIWGILERCWKASPGNRPSIKDVLRCLEEVSKSWTPLPPHTSTDPPTTNSSAQNSEPSTEESTEEDEVPLPSEVISSRQSQELQLKGDPNKNNIYPSGSRFFSSPSCHS